MNIVFYVYFFRTYHFDSFSRFTQEKSIFLQSAIIILYWNNTAVETCVAIISKLIKCKNDRAMIFSPSMALCRGSNSVMHISLIVSLNLESTNAYSTKSDLFITFVIYPIYLLTVARLFLANIFIFSYLLPFAHTHTNISHINALAFHSYTYVTFTLHTCSRRNIYYSRV